MPTHGPDSTEDSNLSLHVLDGIMQPLPNQCLIVILASQNIPLKFQLLDLLTHELLTEFGLFLKSIQLFVQLLSLLLHPTFSLLMLSKFLSDSLLLSLDVFKFLLTAPNNVLSFTEALLRLLLEFLLKLIILLEDLLLNLRLSELGLVLSRLRSVKGARWVH